ncbi:MAG: hypothetical protein R3B54_00380 [Bdellovibrionota bacterium]
MQQILLDTGAEFENLPELRELVLNHLIGNETPELLEVQQHFISLLLIEDTRATNLDTIQPKWTETLVARDASVLERASQRLPSPRE